MDPKDNSMVTKSSPHLSRVLVLIFIFILGVFIGVRLNIHVSLTRSDAARRGGPSTGTTLPDRTAEVVYLGNPTKSDLPDMWLGRAPAPFYPSSTYARSTWDAAATANGKVIFVNGDASNNIGEAHLYYLDIALRKFKYFFKSDDEAIFNINILDNRAVLTGFDTTYGGGKGNLYSYDYATDQFKTLAPMTFATHIYDARPFDGKMFYNGDNDVHLFDETITPYSFTKARYSIDGIDWSYRPYDVKFGLYEIDGKLILQTNGNLEVQPIFYRFYEYIGQDKFLAIPSSRMEYKGVKSLYNTFKINKVVSCLGNQYAIQGNPYAVSYAFGASSIVPKLYKITNFDNQQFVQISPIPTASGDYIYDILSAEVDGTPLCIVITQNSNKYTISTSSDGTSFVKKFTITASYKPEFASFNNDLLWGVRNTGVYSVQNEAEAKNGEVYMLENIVR